LLIFPVFTGFFGPRDTEPYIVITV